MRTTIAAMMTAMLFLALPATATIGINSAEDTEKSTEGILVTIEIEVPEITCDDQISENLVDFCHSLSTLGHERTIIRTCQGTIFLQGGQSCNPNSWTVHCSLQGCDSWTIQIDLTWAFLASGSQSFTLRDPFAVYLVGGCVAVTPAITADDISCHSHFVRDTISVGTHRYSVSHTYDYCLDALSLFNCHWMNRLTLRFNQ
jgi:hypothetical protein